MTLLELLHSVRFDDLVPFIIKYHGDDECMAWYKIHYDMLLQMMPQKQEDEKFVTIDYYEEESDKNTKENLLDAYPLEGELWEVSLGKELVIAPEVTASKEEIAACCLWHTSFHGFTPSQRESYFWEEEGIDYQEAKRFKAMYGNLIPSIKQMLKNKAFHNMVRSDMRVIRSYRFTSRDKKSGYFFKDRKRKWRYWKREVINSLYNSIVTDIGRAIEMLHQGESIVSPPSVKELCEKLFWGKHCHICSYQTYIDDENKRFEYFKQLITKYDAYKTAKLSGAIVCISSSSLYPVKMEELELISLVTQGCLKIEYCVKIDNSLGKELKLSVAFYGDLNSDYNRYCMEV